MKKFVCMCLIFVLLIPSLSISAFAAENNANHYQINIDEGTEVTVVVPSEFANKIGKTEIVSLVQDGHFNNGDVITVQEIVENENEEIQPYLFETYETTTTATGAEYKCQDYFVISAARGQTTTLSSEFSKTITVNITAGDPFVKADIGASVTAKYAITHQFAGPPEGSQYNSREYRVQFYAKPVSWVQTKYSSSGAWLGECAGHAIVPTKYLLYSIDHKV